MLLVTLMRGISIQWKGQRPDTSRLSDEQKVGKMVESQIFLFAKYCQGAIHTEMGEDRLFPFNSAL